MPRFFVPDAGFDADFVRITGDDARHIARALRMATGETVTVCDMHGTVHACVLEKITDEAVTARIVGRTPSDTEPPYPVTLYQAFPKGDKMDVIVQKAVECGACAVVPFLSARCVSRPDDKSMEKKLARWQRIALEAAKQCGRGTVPTVRAPLSFGEMLAAATDASLPLFCYEGDGTASLRTVLAAADTAHMRSVSLVVGSEGGFSEKEAADAADAGFRMCGLGRRILRCESASGFALACIAYAFEL